MMSAARGKRAPPRLAPPTRLATMRAAAASSSGSLPPSWQTSGRWPGGKETNLSVMVPCIRVLSTTISVHSHVRAEIRRASWR